MTEYRLAKPEEWEDCIELANYVFSTAHRPHDFEQLIPRVYQAGPEMARIHRVAVAENGRLRAEIAVLCGADLVLELPVSWACAGAQRFAAGGVGLLSSSGVVSHIAFGSESANLDAITAALQEGDKVQLVGFGSFEVKKRAERVGRNPKTKETIQIAATTAPAFKAGKALKDAVSK